MLSNINTPLRSSSAFGREKKSQRWSLQSCVLDRTHMIIVRSRHRVGPPTPRRESLLSAPFVQLELKQEEHLYNRTFLDSSSDSLKQA